MQFFFWKSSHNRTKNLLIKLKPYSTLLKKKIFYQITRWVREYRRFWQPDLHYSKSQAKTNPHQAFSLWVTFNTTQNIQTFFLQPSAYFSHTTSFFQFFSYINIGNVNIKLLLLHTYRITTNSFFLFLIGKGGKDQVYYYPSYYPREQ